MSHAIRILTSTRQADNPSSVPSPNPPEWAASLLETRLAENVAASTVLPGAEQAISRVPGGVDSVEHLRGLRRYDSSEDKASVVDSVESGVVADAEWYRVEHHNCTHEVDGGGACPTWSVERENGPVPEGL